MRFKVVESFQQIPSSARDCCFLLHTVWDDWFQFETEYQVHYFDENGIRSRSFTIKIGKVGLRGCSSEGRRNAEDDNENLRVCRLPESFAELSDEYFSIGTDDSYYEFFGGNKRRSEIFAALRDVAYNQSLLRRYRTEDSLNVSLLRGISRDRIRSRFAKLAHGKPALTDFSFAYTYPSDDASDGDAPTLDFNVSTTANPPNNIKVVIGRNGVGKTHLLKTLAATLCRRQSVFVDGTGKVGKVEFHDGGVYGLVYASFSAFDDLTSWTVPDQANLVFHAIGLATPIPKGMKIAEVLEGEFVKDLINCRQDPWRTRWLTCLEILRSDPIFAMIEGEELLDCAPWEIKKKAGAFFKKLSSGHAALMLIITQLVCVLDEKFLLLIDEPECHLHPPLLSSFIRCLTFLLQERNAIALVATHSPVILQEVTRDSVWKVDRTGHQVALSKPSMETFGESIGILMNEVFGLEFRSSGYHRLLAEAADVEGCTYESVLRDFDGHLGGEAKALLRVMLALKERVSRA